jgi:hypothetical protein
MMADGRNLLPPSLCRCFLLPPSARLLLEAVKLRPHDPRELHLELDVVLGRDLRRQGGAESVSGAGRGGAAGKGLPGREVQWQGRLGAEEHSGPRRGVGGVLTTVLIFDLCEPLPALARTRHFSRPSAPGRARLIVQFTDPFERFERYSFVSSARNFSLLTRTIDLPALRTTEEAVARGRFARRHNRAIDWLPQSSILGKECR